MPEYSRIRPRRGTASQWEHFNTILTEGEIGIEFPETGIGTGEVKIKFGDGVTPWNDLPYGVNPEMANAIHGGTPESSNDIWLRTGTTEEWLLTDPVLGVGELVYDSTYISCKIGDGSHRFSELPYIRSSAILADSLDLDCGDEDERE